MSHQFVPFHRPSIGPEEFEAVRQVLESGWLTTGPVTHQFERNFAQYIGCKHALAVNSCTAALHLALDAAGVRMGDEVLLPTYTFTATAEVVTYMGARPVLCDSLCGAFNIDPDDAERRITPRTKAIIAVHIAGEACDLQALRRLASKHNLRLIEDAAHALPAWYQGKKIGADSDLAAFSFYATKTITTGEGGMLVTNNDDHARRASLMRLHGIQGDAWNRYRSEGNWYYEVVQPGFKMNLPDLLAAMGISQLRKADTFHERRCEIAEIYRRRFAVMDELELPNPSESAEHSWHLFIVRLRPELIDRNQFIRELKTAGIGTSVHFIPLHFHPYYRDRYGYQAGDFPNAEDAYLRAVSLPIFPGMTEAEIERVVTVVEHCVLTHRRHALMEAA
jgi:dTDP-4-amino-4,6-dideoxygalactose transaminase